MKKHRQVAGGSLVSGVTLFPFLSILFGVIGVMVLMMAGEAALSLTDADQLIEQSPAGEKQRSVVYVECRDEGILIHPERLPIGLPQLRDDTDRQLDRCEQLFEDLSREVGRGLLTVDQAFDRVRASLPQVLEGDQGPWLRLLARLARGHDQEYVVLLVRPDGIEAFTAAEESLTNAGLDFGYEPVYATGDIVVRPATESAGATATYSGDSP